MDQPIRLELTNDDMVRAQVRFARRQRWSVWTLIGAMGAFILAPLLVSLIERTWLPAWQWPIIGGVGALAGVLTIVVMGELSARFVGRRMLAQYPVLRRVHEVDWNDAGLRYRDRDSTTVYAWSEITDADRSPVLIMLALGPRLFLVLPTRCMAPWQADDLWSRVADALATTGRKSAA